ncbi:MAG: endolytic transglycosylase MltG [Pseudonocardia sp.]
MTRSVDVEPGGRTPANPGGSPVQGRRRRVRALVLAVALVLGVGVVVAVQPLFGPPDFDGPGTGSVVVEVRDGATTTQIGAALEREGVVRSTAAFTEAALDEQRIRSVQPGFYQMRAEMSGESAVERLLDPAARIGRLEIRGGVQLDDTRSPDGTVAPGVLTLISRASCTDPGAAEPAGAGRCAGVDELRAAMADTAPEELGVPEWALADVRAADPRRRLEGLLLPGLYDVRPGAPAVEVLRALVTASANRLEASGLVAGAAQGVYSPYEVLVVASLAEKEGITADMPKVARVIYNRLAIGQRLELDSMVNYPLDIQALRTTSEARAQDGPYNSYRRAGLPPTPIAAPGRDALAAAIEPAPGPWLFFVRCQPDGTSCFGETLAEHDANVRSAIANGAF